MKLFFINYFPILLIPKNGSVGGFSAANYVFFIICDKKYINNEDLIQHELTHTKQFLRTFGLSLILYHISKKYRYKAELEAYKVSIKYGLSPEIAANSLSKKYNIGTSYEQALKDLIA